MSFEPEEFVKNLIAKNFKVDKDTVKKKLDEWKDSKINVAFVGDRELKIMGRHIAAQ